MLATDTSESVLNPSFNNAQIGRVPQINGISEKVIHCVGFSPEVVSQRRASDRSSYSTNDSCSSQRTHNTKVILSLMISVIMIKI